MKDDAEGRAVSALPLAILYGANASGKSNLIQAMDFARKLIATGTRGEETIGVAPFRLDPAAAKKSSRFEFVIKHDGVLYTYGFAVDSRTVKEEWLFAVFQKHETRLFERVTEQNKAHVEVGSRLASDKEERQRLQFVASGTRPNQLFLTEANERNVEGLKPLLRWFRDRLKIVWPDAPYQPLILRAHRDRPFTDWLSNFLTIADTGIRGIDLQSENLDENRLLDDLPDDLKQRLFDAMTRTPDHTVVVSVGKLFFALRQEQGKMTVLTLRTKHQRSDGQWAAFDTRDESDGTHRLMHLAPALLDLQSASDVYVVDELDRSLHPHLCRLYIETFLQGVKNGANRGQMILTTHEASLLDLDLLRRDEIWFVEKDSSGASHLASLAEYKYTVRKDLKVTRAYLNGRFGAVPLLGDTERLFPTGGNP
jgi:AAA15 family ATPase/GTPase